MVLATWWYKYMVSTAKAIDLETEDSLVRRICVSCPSQAYCKSVARSRDESHHSDSGYGVVIAPRGCD